MGTIAGGPRTEDGTPVVAQSPYAYSNESTRFVGYLYTCNPGVTNHDEQVTVPIRLQGGYYWVRGASVGDRVSFFIVDVDGVTAPAGTVIREYVQNLPVAPWDHQQDIVAPTAGAIPAGLYLRLAYTNNGATPVTFGVTYRWFQ